MLVVISDLHFEEEKTNNIPGDGIHEPIEFQRNLPSKPYQLLIRHLVAQANNKGIKHMDLALAGDIFDIHRTGLWFWGNDTGERPYSSSTQIGPQLEALILQILEGISTEPHVAEVLETLRLLASGFYLNNQEEEEALPFTIKIHFIAGNHDRLANSTPAINRAIRHYLGLPDSDAPFPYALDFPTEQVLVRHGHEYDYTNFSVDHRETAVLPPQLPVEQYQNPTFGDWATVDLASRLPYEFRKYHTDAKILASSTLRELYLRLLEFDDLRPLTAIFNYFLYAGDQKLAAKDAWKAIEPVLRKMLNELRNDPYLHHWLGKFDKRGLDIIDAVQVALATKPWRLFNHISFKMVESIANQALNLTSERVGVESFVSRESVIRNRTRRFVIAGHTHQPNVALLSHDSDGERYYLDTGTWRNRVPATTDFKQFGRLKTLSYAVVYGPDEDRAALDTQETKIASFDFWTNFTQGWKHTANRVMPMETV